MKKIILISLLTMFLVLITSMSFASPFIACDPYPTNEIQPQYFYVAIDGATPVKVSTWIVDPLGWKLFDIAGVIAGKHEAKVKACIGGTDVWEEACSAEAPFAFTRPPSGLNPPYLKLLK